MRSVYDFKEGFLDFNTYGECALEAREGRAASESEARGQFALARALLAVGMHEVGVVAIFADRWEKGLKCKHGGRAR